MSISFTTWRTWITQGGPVIRTIILAGIATVGGLLWYERTHPDYPTGADEAEIMSALVERHLALCSTGTVGSANAVNAGAYFAIGTNGIISYIDTTNAVGAYPSRRFYYTTVPAVLRTMAAYDGPRFADLWGASPGAGKINEQPIASRPEIILDAENMSGFLWWTNNIHADASQYGEFEFQATNYWYLTTNILWQAARPLAAMRWTIQAFDQPQIDESYSASVAWVGTSQWHAVGTELTEWQDALDEAAADLAAADVFTGSTNGLDDAVLSEHIVRIERVYGGGDYYARLTESAISGWVWAGLNYAVLDWIPPITNINSVTECGSFSNNWSLGGPPQKVFQHPAAVMGTWQTTAMTPRTRNGKTFYRSTIYAFKERIDIRVEGYDTLTNAVIGWAAAYNTAVPQEERFIVDWQFSALTNRAAFWP